MSYIHLHPVHENTCAHAFFVTHGSGLFFLKLLLIFVKHYNYETC